MTLRPVCIAQLIHFVHRFAAKSAAPAPHCEGPPGLLVYPQPRRRLRLAQIHGASLLNSRFFRLFVYHLFPGCRQKDGKGRPFARFALHRDLSAKHCAECLSQVEA